MCFRKFMSVVVICTLSMSAWAEDGDAIGPTIGEVARTKLELERARDQAELRKIANEQLPGALPGVPSSLPVVPGVPSPVSVQDVPVLVAMYGVGSDLRAEVMVDGAILTVGKPKDRVGVWRVASLSPGSMEIVRGKERKTLYVVGRPAPMSSGGVSGVPTSMQGMR